MNFKGKEIKISYVKFKHEETDGNGQEQIGTDRNRQDQISDIENYCIIKKFISHVGILKAKINIPLKLDLKLISQIGIP